MTWFLFAGDMLVMLFMTCLVVWLGVRGSSESARRAALIPLEDEHSAPSDAERP